MADAIKRKEDRCKRCNATRYSTLDLKSGRYVVDIPSVCTDKDRCHGEMKPGE